MRVSWKTRLIVASVALFLTVLANGFGRQEAADEWTREGPLGTTLKRTTDQYPLSDQDNGGGWERYAPMSDEFDGERLDAEKWLPRHPTWKGRPPALFYSDNVFLRDSALHLVMKKQDVPEMQKDKRYHTYTSAAVRSTTRVKYGYFEVKARPMHSAGSSSFWFAGSSNDWRTEIDVYEIGGRAPGFERKYNMNVHVFRTPTETRHWSRHGEWIAPWNLVDDYHVYGLQWDPQAIQYYVDGVLVRRVQNTHWHQPLYMLFDSETMPDWFGLPRDEDLPSTYSVEYVRVWKNEKTRGEESD